MTDTASINDTDIAALAQEIEDSSESDLRTEPNEGRHGWGRYKKASFGLSVVLLVSVVFALYLSLKSHDGVEVDQQRSSDVSSIESGSFGLLPWSDEFSSPDEKDEQLTQSQITFDPETDNSPRQNRPTRVPTRKPKPPKPTSRPTRQNANPSGNANGPISTPTNRPTRRPRPTKQPTRRPTSSAGGSASNPTRRPTRRPTSSAGGQASNPTRRPTRMPRTRPTKRPTRMPTARPTRMPTSSAQGAPTNRPTRRPTPAATTTKATSTTTSRTTTTTTRATSAAAARCSANEYKVEIELLMDKFGKETGYSFASNPDDGSAPVVYLDYPEGSFGANELHTSSLCLLTGSYIFTVVDQYGGMCCADGQGHYKINVDGDEVVYGGNFNTPSITREILVGYEPEVNQRAEDWLDAHNSRRKPFHESNGVEYGELIWSPSLAEEAAAWASELVGNCAYKRETNLNYGENVASRKSPNQLIEDPETVLKRWVENKEGKPYPANQSYTQVMWKGSRWLGCAEESAQMENGMWCFVALCRYARAGNCNVAKYPSWEQATVASYSPCGEACPSEGCF